MRFVKAPFAADILAGRKKNVGKIDGELLYASQRPTTSFFRRCIGYVEQFGILPTGCKPPSQEWSSCVLCRSLTFGCRYPDWQSDGHRDASLHCRTQESYINASLGEACQGTTQLLVCSLLQLLAPQQETPVRCTKQLLNVMY